MPFTQRAPREPWRVRLAGGLTVMSAPGGGEVQLAATAEALVELGIDARAWRPWEESLAEIDVLHLVGSHVEHLPLVAAAKARGVRVALSPVAWFDRAATWSEPRPLVRRVAGCARLALRELGIAGGGWRDALYGAADLLLPNSQAEAGQLERLFGVDEGKIAVVPNGFDLRFATATEDAFVAEYGLRGFVLCAGRIEPRKNQLELVRALRGLQRPVVILGDAPPAHEGYLAACRREADANVSFLPGLAHDDPLLASAYAACGCLALVSRFETPGLVALEAAASGVPLVLTDRGCTKEYFGALAQYVSPDDRAGMRRAIEAALDAPRSAELVGHVRGRFTWSAVARATKAAYETIL